MIKKRDTGYQKNSNLKRVIKLKKTLEYGTITMINFNNFNHILLPHRVKCNGKT